MKIPTVFFVYFAIGIIARAQDNFVSIDCGASSGYRDTTLAVNYTTDSSFVESGHNFQIDSSYLGQVPFQHLRTLRSFPSGTRNCYTLRPAQGKNNKYLIRASFSYGNYDTKSESPTFDLYIDVNFWVTLSPTTYTYQEIVYFPSRDYMQVCLVNRGTGNPIISALELRLLDNSTYSADGSTALALFERDNIGSNTSYRHPQDDYDRIWTGTLDDPSKGFVQITNTANNDTLERNNNYKVPAEVLMTAESTINRTYYWYRWWNSNTTYKWYLYFHFAEIQILQPNETRAFSIYMQGSIVRSVVPEYLKPVTVETLPVSGTMIIFNVSATPGATLPPFFNALEIYYGIDLVNSQTDMVDVDAIVDIKNTYGVIRDSWQGDPCSPREFIWKGLSCNQDNPPRITALDLSSSGLTSTIATSVSNLTALVSLDLSFNQLTGPLPELLAQLPNLKFLNLSGNNIEGPIPDALKKKATARTLQMSLVGNPICTTEAEICNLTPNGNTKKKNVIAPVIGGVAASTIVLGFIMAMFYIRKRRQGQGDTDRPVGPTTSNEESRSFMTSGPTEGTSVLRKMTRAYTSSEVSNITNNFDVTIGHGGFGSVFLGNLSGGTKVAVKVLSQTSKQGYKEFQAEAQLLMIVHHKNLVSLLGYCDEFANMALIYELMPNGNLKQQLSENSMHVLQWSQRVQIAIDAAQGLEYLHNGCKPPIIHRDLKTSNILLDENMYAKIADFGLSRAFKPDQDSYITMPAGTPGYLDPAFHMTASMNRKSDIYSFGIILFELITGHPAIIRNSKSSIHIFQWVIPLVEAGNIHNLVDPRMQSQFDTNSVWKMTEIAVKCVDLTPSRRPDINLVLSELKECLAVETNSSGEQGTETSYLRSSSSLELDLPSAR